MLRATPLSEGISPSLLLKLLFVVFFCSGFAGLIYESIWTHYLKLFLGHAAYAQTLVLSIFMLGMAIGSWLAGRISLKTRHFFLVYAAVELILGLFAVNFHWISQAVSQWFFVGVAPALASATTVNLVKWLLAGLLIGPQSVLIGMTFPLIANGLLQLHPQSTGRMLSLLYFTNSIGASIGVLVSGFVLISWVGLAGTTLISGLMNMLIAMVIFALFAMRRGAAVLPADNSVEQPPQLPHPHVRLLLIVATFTGVASFIYEIVWIRLLSLVLGSATHAFELMLSSFILGLALGGFLIRNKIDHLQRPYRVLAMIQLAMGLAAIFSLVCYERAFVWMQLALAMLDQTEAGYWGFNLVSHLICLLIMLPATLLAGMTLPLIIRLLLKHRGVQSVGNVYALNTLGSIGGVLLTVHLLLPLLGAKNSLLLGALIDMALGLLLLAWTRSYQSRRLLIGLSTTTVLLFAVLFPQQLDMHMLTSGVFRHGNISLHGEVLYYQDGKTATVSVRQDSSGKLSLLTNGKPDASIDPLGVSRDESTQLLLGVIPSLLAQDKTLASVIGFGSGMTTHALLADPGWQRVDTIEIEPAMVAGARLLQQKAPRAFNDPRSRIVYEDAKSYFSSSAQRYGLIIAEPSNPWVSGVASLFTTEFYATVKRYLSQRGVFAQWVQGYELSPELLASIGNALGENFTYYDVYSVGAVDLLFVASQAPISDFTGDMEIRDEGLKQQLQALGFEHVSELAALKMVRKQELAGVLQRINPQVNSDYHPVVDQQAVKSRYLNAHTSGISDFVASGLPLHGSVLPARSFELSNADLAVPYAAYIVDYRKFYEALRQRKRQDFSRHGHNIYWMTRAGCDALAEKVFWHYFPEVFRGLSSAVNRDEMIALWPELRAHACLYKLKQQRDNDWYQLLDAVASHQYLRIQQLSGTLMQQPGELISFPEGYLKQLWLLSAIMLNDAQTTPPFEMPDIFAAETDKNWVSHYLAWRYRQMVM